MEGNGRREDRVDGGGGRKGEGRERVRERVREVDHYILLYLILSECSSPNWLECDIS